jgi:diadenosine tetraphosphatase ApaH/serine/threonine PP2A family protein phosphatase
MDLLLKELTHLISYDRHLRTSAGKQGLLQHVMGMHDRNEKLPREFLLKLLQHATVTTRSCPNVISVRRKCSNNLDGQFERNVTVVGDLHGQYDDVKAIFTNPRIGGLPSNTNYFIFNGDVVDRGERAVEILSLILLAQALFPGSVHYLRGNHEDVELAPNMGFRDEVVCKYDGDLYSSFISYFSTLPVAAVIEDYVFVVHGGISRRSAACTVDKLNSHHRYCAVDSLSWVLYELMWAGECKMFLPLALPVIVVLCATDPTKIAPEFAPSQRGVCADSFGAQTTERFLALNGLKLLIRSHQCPHAGYEVLHYGQCVTVFSASNYCGYGGNQGAVVKFDHPTDMTPRYEQYWAAMDCLPLHLIIGRPTANCVAPSTGTQQSPGGTSQVSTSSVAADATSVLGNGRRIRV